MNITISIPQLIVWLILGALAGATVSFIMRRRRSLTMNILIGLVGAFIGGILFAALGISIAPDLLQLTIGGATITFNDFVSAVVGALLLLGLLVLFRRLR